MKIRITLKDPDGVYDSLRELAMEMLLEKEREGVPSHGILSEEVEALYDEIRDWVEWGEYVTIEIDTLAKTATVVKL